jgi:transcriptional regulator with XRE-family HTH domain
MRSHLTPKTSVYDRLSSNSEQLHDWMQAAGISSLRSLSHLSGVSRRQIDKLRSGETHRLSVRHVLQLARALKISSSELLQLEAKSQVPNPEAIRAEYQRLKDELAEMRSQLLQEFQAETLNTLEPLLLQWPTAAYSAQNNPTAPAVRLLPLLKPLEQLLQSWQIEPIGTVGQVLPYTPQLHQWAGEAVPPEGNELVQISHVGYRQGDKLLYRAKVKFPVSGAL